MYRMKLSLIATALITATSFLSTGCSVGGFVYGARADASKPETLYSYELAKLNPGDAVSISLRNQSIVAGTYLEVDATPNKEYAEEYEPFVSNNSNELPLPSVGEEVVINMRSPMHPETKGQFVGFDPGVIRVQDRDSVRTIRIQLVEGVVRSDGSVADGRTLQSWLEYERIPFMSIVKVSVSADTQRVPLYDVKKVNITNPKVGKWIGLALGAVADVAVIILGQNGVFRVRLWTPPS